MTDEDAHPALCLVIISGPLLWLTARAWEPADIEPGDIVYWLAIPQSAKTIPVFAPCTGPLYSLVRQDGLRPQRVTIRYGTRFAQAEVLEQYRAAFLQRACDTTRDASAIRAQSCTPPIDHMDIDVTTRAMADGTNCNGVTVLIIGG